MHLNPFKLEMKVMTLSLMVWLGLKSAPCALVNSPKPLKAALAAVQFLMLFWNF